MIAPNARGGDAVAAVERDRGGLGHGADVAIDRSTAITNRLEKQSIMNAGRWTRDELYEDDR